MRDGPRTLIAKRTTVRIAQIEAEVYGQILPRLQLEAPRCHALIADDGWIWIILDDTGGRQYSPSAREERIAVAKWVATMHGRG